jgi:hypothetical protein
MKRESAICTAVLSTDEAEEDPFEISYYLTDGTCGTDGAQGIAVFGICAEMRCGGMLVDKCRVDDVSCKKEDVLMLIRRLAACTVTPLALRDVVEDAVAS